MSRRYRPGTLILGLAVVLAAVIWLTGCGAPRVVSVTAHPEQAKRAHRVVSPCRVVEVDEIPVERHYSDGRVVPGTVDVIVRLKGVC